MDNGRHSPAPFAFYGTLMRLRELGEYGSYGPAAVIRGRLYDVGSYPALVEDDRALAHGRLWTPDPDVEALVTSFFDNYEGYDPDDPQKSLYIRKKVRLARPDVDAWTYVWNASMTGLVPVPDGRWRPAPVSTAPQRRNT